MNFLRSLWGSPQILGWRYNTFMLFGAQTRTKFVRLLELLSLGYGISYSRECSDRHNTYGRFRSSIQTSSNRTHDEASEIDTYSYRIPVICLECCAIISSHRSRLTMPAICLKSPARQLSPRFSR